MPLPTLSDTILALRPECCNARAASLGVLRSRSFTSLRGAVGLHGGCRATHGAPPALTWFIVAGAGLARGASSAGVGSRACAPWCHGLLTARLSTAGIGICPRQLSASRTADLRSRRSPSLDVGAYRNVHSALAWINEIAYSLAGDPRQPGKRMPSISPRITGSAPFPLIRITRPAETL